MYVPNFQKWVSYYNTAGKGNHNPFLNRIQQGGKGGVQVGGSLSSGQGSFMVPIESSNNTRKISNPNKVTVNMVSPTEQTIQMAEKQINATKRGVKRKRNLSRNHSSKRRRRGQMRKKLSTHKKVKSIKKKKKTKTNRTTKNKKSLKKKLLKAKRRVLPISDILN